VFLRHVLRAAQGGITATFEKRIVRRRCYLQDEATTPGG
jgi:hypothetical protein